ncbi:MAG: DUF192 domain-containing protein [bacterium]|nr:DUF192 domain-containing protein [bacterium]
MIQRKRLLPLIAITFMVVFTACSAPQPSSTNGGAAPQAADVITPMADLAPAAYLPDGQVVTLELAITPDELSRGLMYRPSLPEDRGMLFIHQQATLPTMWMKHTLIPLDLIYLSKEGIVVDLHKEAQPCPAEPCPLFKASAPTLAVLELLGGSASRHNIEVGTRIKFLRVPDFPRAASE